MLDSTEATRLIARKQARIPQRWLHTVIQMIEDHCAKSHDNFDYGIVSEIVMWIFLYEPEAWDSHPHLVGCLGTRDARHLGIIGPPNPNLTPDQQARVDSVKSKHGAYFKAVEKAEKEYARPD